MKEQEGHNKFSEAVDKLHAKHLSRPEASRFSYYDARGCQINDLLSDINMQIVQLHDEVLKNVFTDIDYYKIVEILPMWLRDAGHSQESAMSRAFFEKMVGANRNYLINKCLYYYDCEMLVNALQNRFNQIETMLSEVYDILTPVLKIDYQDYDSVIFTINEDSQKVNAYFNSIIINLASSCDIMTKIAVELTEMGKLDFKKYPKMFSANVTYGQCKKLPDALKVDGTYFAISRPVAIAKVETLRDEIIHNGSLNFHALVYYGVKGEEIESWVLMPEFNADGTFASYLGRKKFYDDPMRTMNRELPVMVIDFLKIALSTVQLLLSTFCKPYYENSDDLIKYQHDVLGLTQSFYDFAKKGYK